MALMLADERLGDFRAIGDFGFAGPVPQLSRASSFMPRLDAGHTVALDDPDCRRRGSPPRRSSSGATRASTTSCPASSRARRLPCWRSGARTATSRSTARTSALLTAVAGQVATAIENGRLYRQLHLKAEELGRMREFNENILESLDDGLVVFDADERIVRWNHALERFYGVARAEAIGTDARRDLRRAVRRGAAGRPPGESRTARRSSRCRSCQHAGAVDGSEGESARLLVNATVVPLQNSPRRRRRRAPFS